MRGKAKIWQLFGRSGKGNLCGVTLRRLVTSRKAQFRWRNPEINPFILREGTRNTVTSHYHDVAMAMSHS
jgi:RNA-directed DNA polymerase